LALIGDDLAHTAGRSPDQVAENRETSRSLRDALKALPRLPREVIVCRYLLDLSEQDTAQVLGIPRGTVKSRLSRGISALQVMLGASPAQVSADREGSGA
jgi:RNA polymerase sigma factor (sigma-70 family)